MLQDREAGVWSFARRSTYPGCAWLICRPGLSTPVHVGRRRKEDTRRLPNKRASNQEVRKPHISIDVKHSSFIVKSTPPLPPAHKALYLVLTSQPVSFSFLSLIPLAPVLLGGRSLP